MSIAPLVGGWQQLYGGWPASPAASGPSDVTHPIVELFLGEQWVDITSYVYYRDMITITRGRRDEATQTDPSSCRFTVNNRDGRFSPRNPTGPYYGLIGRNTPVRVSIIRNGERRYRFHGEVSSWPVKWDISGSDVYVEVEAAGILRRLSQRNAPLLSPMRREFTAPSRTNIVAYWPFEDLGNASVVASGISGHQPMTVAGTATFATYTDWAGSDALPTLGTATFSGIVPSYTATGEIAVRFFVHAPAAGVTTTQTLLDISTTGTASRWRVYLDSTGGLAVKAVNKAGTVLLDTGFIAFAINDVRCSLILELTQGGSGVDFRLREENYTSVSLVAQSVPATEWTGTVAVQTCGRVTSVRVGTDGGLGDVAVGHLSVADALTAYTHTGSAVVGWRGETPTNRVIRLCQEEGISYQDLTHGTTGTVYMGVQGIDTLVNALNECAATDLSTLVELRDQLGLGFRTRTSLYNQDAALTLDYAQNQLSAALDPVDDDRYTNNDVTVSRVNGSSDRKVLDSGTLSVQDPPNGVGRYATSVSVSLRDDDLLPDQASWRLHMGTVDEARYPQISLNLRHSTFTSSVDMMNAALMLDVGDRLVVDNPPAWLPPDAISQIVEGFTETLGVLEHDIVITCSPESAYHVMVLDDDSDTRGRLDTAGSELTDAITASATTMSVTTTSGPVWVDSNDYSYEFPFDVRVGGEVMTVTGITGDAEDNFNRTVTSGWGTADSGQAWTTSGGSASEYYVEGV